MSRNAGTRAKKRKRLRRLQRSRTKELERVKKENEENPETEFVPPVIGSLWINVPRATIVRVTGFNDGIEPGRPDISYRTVWENPLRDERNQAPTVGRHAALDWRGCMKGFNFVSHTFVPLDPVQLGKLWLGVDRLVADYRTSMEAAGDDP